MMAIRIPWDKYEAALLLDYCIKVENKVLSRDEAVSLYRSVYVNEQLQQVLKLMMFFEMKMALACNTLLS